MSRPDHRRSRAADRRGREGRPLDVLVGHVAEDAAQQEQVDGHDVRPDVRVARIRGADLESGSQGLDVLLGRGGELGVELDQAAGQVGRTRMAGRGGGQVPAVAGAQRQHPDRTGTGPVERRGDLLDDDGEALRMPCGGIVVLEVPLAPVPRHAGTVALALAGRSVVVVGTGVDPVTFFRVGGRSDERGSELREPFGTTRYQIHRPRLSPTTRPASDSTLRWCETVGWARPTGATRSHAHTSPAAAEARRDRMRSRAGSASAAKPRASSAASASLKGASPIVGQHSSASSTAIVFCRTTITPSIDRHRWIRLSIDSSEYTGGS